ncbi:MAG: glutamate--tRNA ligase [Holosporaceae bacterium]|jgi:glutamyl-tRNA synthetase|nr:glutamate--tRNA ligase [Holosporaceae bacterium]
MEKVLVRFAPSPTGLLHVGNVRIALFNYLYTKKNDGKFILRIDDTDRERSTQAFEDFIFEDLKWLGIQWDEVYRQSDNIEKYQKAIDYLKEIGRVYPCYEKKEELSLKRKIQISTGKAPVYDRAALKMSGEKRKELKNAGINPYWRFKLNDSEIAQWNDLVHGEVSIPLNSVSDPILVKPDGSFVYAFASVVDDINMGITHIIRGDDHITNTAVQIDIFKALSGKIPDFAHIPLLSSLDGQDVSKRSGSSLSVGNMRNEGIEARAIVCILATLGTSDNVCASDNYDSLINKFSFGKISLSPPKFNLEEAKALAKKILGTKTFSEVKSSLEKMNLENISEKFWYTIRENLSSLQDAVLWDKVLSDKNIAVKEDKVFVDQMLKSLQYPFNFDQWISDLKQISNRKGKDLFHPIRLVLTGIDHGPELKKITELMGYERVKKRIESNLTTE